MHLRFTLLFFFSSLNLFAQQKENPARYGFKTGLVHTYIRYESNFAANNYLTYGQEEGIDVHFVWQKGLKENLRVQVESGYLKRVIRDNVGVFPLTQRGKTLYLHYITIPAFLAIKGPYSVYFGVGSTGNFLLSGPNRSIAQHEIEWLGLLDITKQLGAHWGISLRYQRGYSKLGEDYHLDPITNIDDHIALYSRSFTLSTSYIF
jgi:hypothetical protein